jgi:hypothetical protein
VFREDSAPPMITLLLVLAALVVLVATDTLERSRD